MIIAMQMIKEGKNNGSGGCTGKGRIKGRSFLREFACVLPGVL